MALGLGLVLLSGCDQVKQTLIDISTTMDKQLNIPGVPVEFWPDDLVVMDGQPTRIQGFDDCIKSPRSHFEEIFMGPDETPDFNCLIIKPDTASAKVKYFPYGQEPAVETWVVERDDLTFRLRRPNGEYIRDVRNAQ
jgi:hypothetical protein